MRAVTASLAGSSLFPSWTRDGRLSFRYDGDDYRGFMFADNVLSAPERPLPPAVSAAVPAAPRWSDLFPETREPAARTSLVMVWATWSAHSPEALRHLQDARATLAGHGVEVLTALDPASRRDDADRMRQQDAIVVPEISLAPDRFTRTEAANQIPTTLLFRDGTLVDRRLGAQTADELRAWALTAGRTGGSPRR